MRRNSLAVICGFILLTVGPAAVGSAYAEGDAEAAPSPLEIHRLPSEADVPAQPQQAPRPPVRTIRLDASAGSAKVTPVKALLPADYRPAGQSVPQPGGTATDGSSAAKDPVSTKAPTKKSGKQPVAEALVRKRIPLAPTEADLRRERAIRDGGPDAPAPDNRSTGDRLADQATRIPTQRRSWPTTVTNTAGPTSPAGPGSAQDRKGTMIEASGPQQGVIRNRW